MLWSLGASFGSPNPVEIGHTSNVGLSQSSSSASVSNSVSTGLDGVESTVYQECRLVEGNIPTHTYLLGEGVEYLTLFARVSTLRVCISLTLDRASAAFNWEYVHTLLN